MERRRRVFGSKYDVRNRVFEFETRNGDTKFPVICTNHLMALNERKRVRLQGRMRGIPVNKEWRINKRPFQLWPKS
jgi:hypothetical protein